MSTSPLHYKNADEEIYDISSYEMNGGYFKVNLVFGKINTSRNAGTDKKIKEVQVEFTAPTRFDFYSDEGFDQSFKDAEKFSLFHNRVPGLIVSSNSKYLEDYKTKEEWAAICGGDDLKHFVVWSYGSGVIHILSDIDPIIGKISNAH